MYLECPSGEDAAFMLRGYKMSAADWLHGDLLPNFSAVQQSFYRGIAARLTVLIKLLESDAAYTPLS